jgi:hypothetical protein
MHSCWLDFALRNGRSLAHSLNQFVCDILGGDLGKRIAFAGCRLPCQEGIDFVQPVHQVVKDVSHKSPAYLFSTPWIFSL